MYMYIMYIRTYVCAYIIISHSIPFLFEFHSIPFPFYSITLHYYAMQYNAMQCKYPSIHPSIHPAIATYIPSETEKAAPASFPL